MGGAMGKKLIEVALPLEVINREAALRKRKAPAGYPTTIHKWWAQRPIAACRAILFSSLVDDPDQEGVSHTLLELIDCLPLPDSSKIEWSSLTKGEQRRLRLFAFIEQLVKWENSVNEAVLTTARQLINASTNDNPPPMLDPFSGGGSIPLEAQRLGLVTHASDLNPVAVLITKALLELPPLFAECPPVNPDARQLSLGAQWNGATGLASDVRYYGTWMAAQAERRIGHLYPRVKLPSEQGGGEATVVAWLWARTVTCPNPACGARMPLVSSFWLSTKAGKKAWLEPIVDHAAKSVRFEVRTGSGMPGNPPKLGRGAKFRCLVCEGSVGDQHIKSEGTVSRLGTQLMALVAEGQRGRVYLEATPTHALAAEAAIPQWAPEQALPHDPRNIWCTLY